MSFYVGVSVEPSREAVAAAFAQHAPDARLRWCDIDEDCENAIFIELCVNKSEFPFVLGTINLTAYDCYRLGMGIARELSIALRCRTVCDGTWHGSFSSPFWCLVWDQGQAYLGVDAGTVFGDDSPELTAQERAQLGPIKLLHPLTPEQLAQPEREPAPQAEHLDRPQPTPM
ncbi:hypothetical protein [Lysobacter enzymogenes]|uniref:hypothetical protein n=1 Tax=Lysobacter enzymogenes TaxID=69 RepID=UPI000899E801|nr:hypothetical protein [Lysobacter enzymogenes]SDW89763.1 hypothetical protein SAMN05421681_103154 [Lysobacter enzymogenes]